jgi:hypothetical protein
VLNPILLEKGIRSLVGVPLLLHGAVIGVLHVGTVQQPASRLTAVVCSGRNRPHDSKGRWLAMPRARRS